jgi:hypothetical protein
MLERLIEENETLTERNGLLECKNITLQKLCDKTIFVKEEDEIPNASSRGTEDEKESEEEIEEEPIRSTSRGEDVEAPIRRMYERVFSQIENDVYIDNEAKPRFKSRDFNPDNNLLNEENLYQLIRGFLENATVEPFQKPEGYPVQMKSHPWWDDELHNFKGKVKNYFVWIEENQNRIVSNEFIDEILRDIEDKVFVDVEQKERRNKVVRARVLENLKELNKLTGRKPVIDHILRQIEDNVFVDSELVNPKFKSRDFNRKDQFLSAEMLHEVILRFAKNPTVEPFTTPEGYPVQMKSHLWWTDNEHNFKQKIIFFMEHLRDSDLNIRDPIENHLLSQIRASKFNRLTDLEVAFEDEEALESEGGGEDEDEKGPWIWNASPDQITTIVDYIGKNFFLDGDGDLKDRKFKNKFNSASGDAFTPKNLQNSYAVIVHNFENGKLSSFKPDDGSTFQTQLGEDPSWGPDGENYKERTERYLFTYGFSRMVQAP